MKINDQYYCKHHQDVLSVIEKTPERIILFNDWRELFSEKFTLDSQKIGNSTLSEIEKWLDKAFGDGSQQILEIYETVEQQISDSEVTLASYNSICNIPICEFHYTDQFFWEEVKEQILSLLGEREFIPQEISEYCPEYDEAKINPYTIEDLLYWQYYFEPKKFNSCRAKACNLIPFKTGELKLLALPGCGMDFSPCLDAYQFLMDESLPSDSRWFDYQSCDLIKILNFPDWIVTKIDKLVTEGVTA